MASTKPILKTAWMLLCLCLLVGEGRAGVCAGENAGIQVVLALDVSDKQQQDQPPEPVSQAANLLIHLLKDDDCLGLVSTGDPQGLTLPTNALSPEQRSQALKKLASLVPAPQQQPDAEVVGQALGMFKADGPKPRFLFILSEQSGEVDRQQHSMNPQGVDRLAAQARTAGVMIYAVSLSPKAAPVELQTLARATGGRVWEGKTLFGLQMAMLNFYQQVKQPQEVPVTGNEFRLDPWVKQAAAAAARSAPGEGAVLISPRGERLTPRTSPKTVRWHACQGYDLIIISHPRPGVWSLAGVRPGDSRIFLDTDILLSNAGTPGEVGGDEAFVVTAALSGPKEIVAGAKFRAEFQVSNSPPLTTELHVQEPGPGSALQPGIRFGRFPPLPQEGEGTLRILAQGRGLQRLVTRPFTIASPWYRPVVPKTEASDAPLIRFQPEPSRPPGRMGGTVAWQSAQGALAGAFINPAPGSEIVMARPKGGHDLSLADLHLVGTAPGGRPLEIASGPCRFMSSIKGPDKPLEITQPASIEKKAQDGGPSSLPRKAKRRWLWLAVFALGIAVFLACGFVLVRERLAAGNDDEDGGQGAPSKNVLRLKAQVEALTKEKAQLAAALDERTSEFDRLMAEKANLESELERFREKNQGNSKTLEELEKKLEDAEREAKGVQEEYMALYARNQKEKEGLQKK